MRIYQGFPGRGWASNHRVGLQPPSKPRHPAARSATRGRSQRGAMGCRVAASPQPHEIPALPNCPSHPMPNARRTYSTKDAKHEGPETRPPAQRNRANNQQQDKSGYRCHRDQKDQRPTRRTDVDAVQGSLDRLIVLVSIPRPVPYKGAPNRSQNQPTPAKHIPSSSRTSDVAKTSHRIVLRPQGDLDDWREPDGARPPRRPPSLSGPLWPSGRRAGGY